MELQDYVDANLTGDTNSKKNTMGFVYTLSGTDVSWGSNLQKIVVLSSTEDKYVTVSKASNEMIWLQSF